MSYCADPACTCPRCRNIRRFMRAFERSLRGLPPPRRTTIDRPLGTDLERRLAEVAHPLPAPEEAHP